MSYNRIPFTKLDKFRHGHDWQGYEDIVNEISKKLQSNKQTLLMIETYPGVRINELMEHLILPLQPKQAICLEDEIYIDNIDVQTRIKDLLTDDRIFSHMIPFPAEYFVSQPKLDDIIKAIEAEKGLTIVFGMDTSLIRKEGLRIYADLARWEIQQRYRSNEIANWKHDNFTMDPLTKFKIGYFFEWRLADKVKQKSLPQCDYLLDTNIRNQPKMITTEALFAAMKQTVQQPFRVVPFFDPGIWGGQWMKEVCDLDRDISNYAWCFDCVPEENSLLIEVGATIVEIPSINLVFFETIPLLGNKIHARFGKEFPIRFDFLDTMDGQNLSLQVHPLTEYAQEKFGIHYTQDESYYILDAKEGAVVYLGCKTGTKKEDLFRDLRRAQSSEQSFDDEKYINKIPANKHDHFLIPAGTIHCSGTNTMVLEISATPYIFTFKLWDWGRLGLDGKPRPIHIDHGENVVQIDRDTEWVYDQIVNKIDHIHSEDGIIEERTGLHQREFIETRRHWFSKKVEHDTEGIVNVLNLVEGEEAIIESPINSFEPYIVHYAETFIIPACVGRYTIRPFGVSEGKTLATIKAYVRT